MPTPTIVVLYSNSAAPKQMSRARTVFPSGNSLAQHRIPDYSKDNPIVGRISSDLNDASHLVLVLSDPKWQANHPSLIQTIQREINQRPNIKSLFVATAKGTCAEIKNLQGSADLIQSDIYNLNEGGVLGFIQKVIAFLNPTEEQEDLRGFKLIFERLLLLAILRHLEEEQNSQNQGSTIYNVDEFCKSHKSIKPLLQKLLSSLEEAAVDFDSLLNQNFIQTVFKDTCDFLIQAYRELESAALNQTQKELRGEILGQLNLPKLEEMRNKLDATLIANLINPLLKYLNSSATPPKAKSLPSSPAVSPHTNKIKPIIPVKQLDRLIFDPWIINLFDNLFRLRSVYGQRNEEPFTPEQAADLVGKYLGLDFKNVRASQEDCSNYLSSISTQNLQDPNDYQAYLKLDSSLELKKRILEEIFSLDPQLRLDFSSDEGVAKIFFALASEQKRDEITNKLEGMVHKQKYLEGWRQSIGRDQCKRDEFLRQERVKREALRLRNLFMAEDAAIGRVNARSHRFSRLDWRTDEDS